MDRYDPPTDTWRKVARLISPRGNPGVATVGKRIFAVGGAGESEALATSEVYDPEADLWRVLEAKFRTARASLSADRGARGAPGARETITAFGGFQGTAQKAVATDRVEGLEIEPADLTRRVVPGIGAGAPDLNRGPADYESVFSRPRLKRPATS